MALEVVYPIQAAGVKHGAKPVFGLLDDLFSEGVVESGDLSVIQNPAGADLSVTVSPGDAYIAVETTNGGKRRVSNDANSNSGRPGFLNATDWLATFTAADATNPRIDRVVAIVRDSNVDGGSGAYDVKFKVISGAPTAGATLANLNGAAVVPANSILLANVLVAAGASSVVTAQIDTTVRAMTKIGAGVAGVGGGRSYAHVRDQKASGTEGGSSVASAWTTRVLNTEVADPDGVASLAANQVTLQPGTYECRIIVPFFSAAGSRAKTRLRNVTDAVTTLVGTNAYMVDSQGESHIVGRFTIATAKTFEVQYYATAAHATNGLGLQVSGGTDAEIEVYTVAEFWKVG